MAVKLVVQIILNAVMAVDLIHKNTNNIRNDIYQRSAQRLHRSRRSYLMVSIGQLEVQNYLQYRMQKPYSDRPIHHGCPQVKERRHCRIECWLSVIYRRILEAQLNL